ALTALAKLSQPEQVLHVVSDLVGDHVGLREVAGRAEPVTQRAEEAEIEVELMVGRTVERSDRRARRAARRLDGAREEDELRVAVLLAEVAEDLAPGVLGVGEHNGDEVANLVAAGRRGGRRRLRRRRL